MKTTSSRVALLATLLIPMILPFVGYTSQEPTRDELIQRFKENYKTQHQVAYEAAEQFIKRFPDDQSEDGKLIKNWATAYEKVTNTNQPKVSDSTASPATGTPSANPTRGDAVSVFSPEDARKFAEGRAGLEKFNDCKVARSAFEEVSKDGQKNAQWLFYMAKAEECLGNFRTALTYYEQYDSLRPGQANVTDKIGEIKYRIRKEGADREAREAAAEAERRAREAAIKATHEAFFSSTYFVQIPAGEFMMGSNKEKECKPIHKVQISRSFEIGKYEVTQAQWETIMGNNPSSFKGANLPVEQVSWNDVQQFIQKLNTYTTSYTYRLPTEAEWEYTCRSGTTGDYAGDLGDIAWYSINSDRKTHPVGQKKPNAWGVYDMFGNVMEWCQDWLSYDYYAQSPSANPTGPSLGVGRVVRGGFWERNEIYLQAAKRFGFNIDDRRNFIGFRLVRTLR